MKLYVPQVFLPVLIHSSILEKLLELT